MWIHHLPIGHTTLTLIIMMTVVFFVIPGQYAGIPVVRIILAATTVILIWLAATLGVWLRRHRFTDRGQLFEVLDYFLFRNPSQNRRVVQLVHTGSLVSARYLNPRKTWAYLDIVRSIIAAVPDIRRVHALVLGGGAGAMGYLLYTDFGFRRIDLVERSRRMIDIAERFFLPGTAPSLKWHRTTADVYTSSTTVAYDVIIVDIFDGSDTDADLNRIVPRLAGILRPGGIVIMNFGFRPATIGMRVRRHLPGIRFLVWGKNTFGVWSNTKRLLTNGITADTIPAIVIT